MYPEFSDEHIMAFFKEKLEDKDRDKWIVWFNDVPNSLGHGVRAAINAFPSRPYSPLPTINAFPSWPYWVLIARTT